MDDDLSLESDDDDQDLDHDQDFNEEPNEELAGYLSGKILLSSSTLLFHLFCI